MAITNIKKQEETAKNTTPVQSAAAYNGMQGVSANTANNLGNYQQGYKPSEAVTAAQQNLQNVQAQKPQNYASKYSGALDNILQQIRNPQEFKYEFNADNLFKNYADLYTQKGKQASLDTMGQAAALTGGYGNSYATNAANQAYQQYLLSLYDKGIDLYDRARQRYQDDLANNYNIYNTLYNADQADYGKYRDTVADWQAERDYYSNAYNNERNFDYNDYSNMLNYYTTLAGAENSAWLNDQQMAANQAAEDRKYAYNYAMSILQNGQMPTDDILAAAGLSREDAQKMMAQMIPAGSGGGYGGGGGGSGKETEYFIGSDGTYFKMVNGKVVPVDVEDIKAGDMINTDWLDATNNLQQGWMNNAAALANNASNAGNAATAAQQVNNPSQSWRDQISQLEAQRNELQKNNKNGQYDAQISALNKKINNLAKQGNG